MVIPYTYLVWTLKRMIDHGSYTFFKSKLAKYKGAELEKKIQKCSKGCFKVVFFSVTTFVGYFLVLSDTNFNPPAMFGNGDIRLIFSDFPFTQMPRYVKLHYML